MKGEQFKFRDKTYTLTQDQYYDTDNSISAPCQRAQAIDEEGEVYELYWYFWDEEGYQIYSNDLSIMSDQIEDFDLDDYVDWENFRIFREDGSMVKNTFGI